MVIQTTAEFGAAKISDRVSRMATWENKGAGRVQRTLAPQALSVVPGKEPWPHAAMAYHSAHITRRDVVRHRTNGRRMNEQLELLASDDVGPPRCRDCTRPARKHRKRRTYFAYCEGQKCGTRGVNRDRVCRICNEPFAFGGPGAGTKYCSSRCKALGYHPKRRLVIRCSWCGNPSPGITRAWSKTNLWPYVCNPCLEPLKFVLPSLKKHRVSVERARRLLTEPGCEVCGVNLLERRRTNANALRSRLAVDHDHRCCPDVANSCGKCVRGLVCQPCNMAAGMVRDDPNIARSLAAYLDTWITR